MKIVVVGYGLLLIVMFIFQEKMIFFPNSSGKSLWPQFAQYEKTFTNGDVSLQGWLIKNEVSRQSPLVIYYGGNAEEVSVNLLDLHKFKTGSLLLVNYRGFGKSQGKPTENNLVQDALVIFDQIVKLENVDPGNVFLMGRSLGSGVAVQVAANRKIGGLILVTPFDSLVNVAKTHYPIFPVKTIIRHPFNSVALAQDITVPTLSLFGTSDEVIPNKHTVALNKALGGPVKSISIQGAGHNDIQNFTQYWDEINGFLMGSD